MNNIPKGKKAIKERLQYLERQEAWLRQCAWANASSSIHAERDKRDAAKRRDEIYELRQALGGKND